MSRTPTIVVGIDESTDNRPTLDWAIDEAMSRGARIRIVHVFADAMSRHMVGTGGTAKGTAVRAAPVELRRLTDDAVDYVVSVSAVTATGVTLRGEPVRILVAESELADLVVVGPTRNRATLLGSVSAGIAGRSKSPVVVARRMAGPLEPGAPVVVGVDDSVLARDVLAFAFAFASRHCLPVRAVRCWQPRPDYSDGWITPSPREEQARAATDLSEALAGWRERYPKVPVGRHVIRRHTVRGLLEDVSDARLLVVGAHGRHPTLDRMLGSVSQVVLHRAPCPVAVVHGTNDRCGS